MSVAKYTKKPVTIEALQWTGENITDVIAFCNVCYMKPIDGKEQLQISTLEGSMTASVGDYIIKGVKGEFYPCKPDIFELTYNAESEIGEVSDGYHTFNELYEFRKMYNVALFNEWAKDYIVGSNVESGPQYNVHKSWKHNDGELCFGGGWFIVVADLPGGQISNHYKAEDWDLFKIPEVEKALLPFDGHTGNDVIDRLKNL